jgi:hypothetical protein
MDECAIGSFGVPSVVVRDRVVGRPAGSDVCLMTFQVRVESCAYGQGAGHVWQTLRYTGSEVLMSGLFAAAYGQGVRLQSDSLSGNAPSHHPRDNNFGLETIGK